MSPGKRITYQIEPVRTTKLRRVNVQKGHVSDPKESSIPKCGGGTEGNNDDKIDYNSNSNP
jgi:hypothetical protein